MSNKPERAVIYRRVSSHIQRDEGTSLESQDEQALEHCAQHGYVVIDDIEEAHSGAELDERPKMTALRQRFRNRDFDVLIVWKFDRLSREQTHQAVIIYEASKFDIRVESVLEQFDDTPLGVFMRSVMGFVAEVERENIKLRTYTGRRKRVEKGALYGSHHPPYGYSFADDSRKRLVINPLAAPIVERIFHELANGATLRSVCNGLLTDNIPTPRGKKYWGIRTLHIIINNPLYWGDPRALRYKVKKVQMVDQESGQVVRRKHRDDTEGVALPLEVAQPIVTPEIAQRAQATLVEAPEHTPPRLWKTSPETYLLRGGFIRCGRCKRSLTTRFARKVGEYVCVTGATHPGQCQRLAIRSHLVDGPVWDIVLQILSKPELLRERLQIALTSKQGVDDPQTLQEQLADIQKQQKQLALGIAKLDDEEASAPLLFQLTQLAEDAKRIRARLHVYAEQAEVQEAIRSGLRRLEAWCENIVQRQELSYEDKRLVLKMLGIEVYLNASTDSPLLQ